MTYQHGNGVAWRFMLVEGSIDLNSIVLENQIVKNPKEVLKDFLISGYKPISQITDSGLYRKILYGNIDTRREKDLSAFREYSLMETVGEYRHIPDMQSSIFVDSSVKAGAIEKAITSGYGAVNFTPMFPPVSLLCFHLFHKHVSTHFTRFNISMISLLFTITLRCDNKNIISKLLIKPQNMGKTFWF